MMAAFSSDTRFLQIKEMVLKEEKGGSVTMYSIAEELENVGKRKGMEEGIKEGKEEGKRKIICHMLEHKKSPDDVSELTGEPVEYVYRIQKEYLEMVREDKNYDTKKD